MTKFALIALSLAGGVVSIPAVIAAAQYVGSFCAGGCPHGG
jgi:hypothetical protein